MPLFARARIEVFLPDLLTFPSQELLIRFNQEFSHTFGGATIVRGLDGSYLSNLGHPVRDRINLIFTDSPFSFEQNFALRVGYQDRASPSPAASTAMASTPNSGAGRHANKKIAHTTLAILFRSTSSMPTPKLHQQFVATLKDLASPPPVQ